MAEPNPKGNTEKTKYLVHPLQFQEMPKQFCGVQRYPHGGIHFLYQNYISMERLPKENFENISRCVFDGTFHKVFIYIP